jgi:hypothetical protein
MYSIHREIQYEAILVWHNARPSIIKLSSHLVVFAFAAICVAVMLIITYGLLEICDFLFNNNDNYVKAVCVIGEVFISLYIIRFTESKTIISQ